MAYLGRTPSQAVRSRYYFTASGGETSLSGNDSSGNTLTFTDGNYVDVNLNGATLVAGSDYNTTTANTIGGLAALTASDVVEIVVYDTFSVFGGNVLGDFTISNGTLTAQAVSVSSLSTTGNITFGDNDKAIFGAGSDLEIYHDGNSKIADVGDGKLEIHSNGTGVFIQKGATEYMGKFETDGAVTLYYDNAAKLATTSTGVDVEGNLIAKGYLASEASNSTNKWLAYTYTDNTFRINYNGAGADEITIDSSGNVGIGMTPTYKLDISGEALRIKNTSGTGYIIDQNSNSSVSHILYENSFMRFGTNSAERMRIDSSGNLLVGGTTFDTGNFSNSCNGINVFDATHPLVNLVETTGGTSFFMAKTTSSCYIGTADAHFIGFSTSDAERMRLDSSGNLLIGTNTTSAIDTPGYRFIPGAAGYSEFARTANDGSANIYLSRGNDGRMLAFYRVDGGNTQVGSVTVTSSSTAYNTSSDYRLKENVVDLTGATERLKQLKPKRFNFIADADKTIDGFLAHEAQAVVPEAVSGEKDAMIEEVLYVDGDEIPEGKKVGDVKTASTIDPQGIDQSKLVPLLVATIKELEARITTLEAN